LGIIVEPKPQSKPTWNENPATKPQLCSRAPPWTIYKNKVARLL